jgi:hypothetical protein
MDLRRVKIQKTSINRFMEVFCATQVDKIQTKNFARKGVHGTDFRSDSSAFLFKYDRVIFHACKLAGAVHDGSNRPGTNPKRKPKRSAGGQYTAHS